MNSTSCIHALGTKSRIFEFSGRFRKIPEFPGIENPRKNLEKPRKIMIFEPKSDPKWSYQSFLVSRCSGDRFDTPLCRRTAAGLTGAPQILDILGFGPNPPKSIDFATKNTRYLENEAFPNDNFFYTFFKIFVVAIWGVDFLTVTVDPPPGGGGRRLT